MKRLIIIVLLGGFLSATAQPNRQSSHIKEIMKDLSPEEAAELSTKKLTLALNLNETQQDEIYELELEIAKDRNAKRSEREEKMNSDVIEKPTKDEVLARLNARLDKRIAHKETMKSILDEEQFKRWEHISAKKHQQRKNARKRHIKRKR